MGRRKFRAGVNLYLYTLFLQQRVSPSQVIFKARDRLEAMSRDELVMRAIIGGVKPWKEVDILVAPYKVVERIAFEKDVALVDVVRAAYVVAAGDIGEVLKIYRENSRALHEPPPRLRRGRAWLEACKMLAQVTGWRC